MPAWTEEKQRYFIYTLRGFGFAVGAVVTALGLYYLISKTDTTGDIGGRQRAAPASRSQCALLWSSAERAVLLAWLCVRVGQM